MKFEFILTENDITVDLTILKDLIGDDILSIKPFIELFITNMPRTIETLKNYYDQKDWENVYKTAHFTKSSVSVIKVESIYNASANIEIKAKNNTDLDSIKPLINFIEQQYNIAEKLLKTEVSKLNS